MTSAKNPPRVVDTHMHHWDPANTEWFPHLAPEFDLSLIGIEHADRLKVRYLQPDYLAETAAWRLDAYIHVNATSGPRAFLDEPARLADVGGPLRGLIGTVNLFGGDESPTTQLEIQARTPLFRGVRIIPAPDLDSADMHAVLSFLEQNHYLYEVFLAPDAMPKAAAVFRRYPELEVVVEHLGWTTRATPDRRDEWLSGMRQLADLGPRVTCKISGIGLVAHELDAAGARPWVEAAIEDFGSRRCMFGSNFPVDRQFGSYDDMMRAYLAIIEPLGAEVVASIFAENAERVYGLERPSRNEV
jgi:predicted TIM-barrel fold metal-dependent hydrolase